MKNSQHFQQLPFSSITGTILTYLLKKQETLFALCETRLNLFPLIQSNTPVFLITYQKIHQ